MASHLKSLNCCRWSLPQRSLSVRRQTPTICAAAVSRPATTRRVSSAPSTKLRKASAVAVPLPLPELEEFQQATTAAPEQSLPRAAEGPLYVGKHAVVVGAGPCGTLSAIYLAQQGFTVDVCERRPAPPRDSPLKVGPRSFCIMLHRRGLEALAGAGISLPASMCLKRGSVVRFRGTQMYTTEASPWSHSVNRDLLTAYLITEAQEQYQDKIKFHFETSLEDLSLDGKTASFKSAATGATFTVPYDFLIGADGASSRTRAYFADQVPGFSFTQAADDMEYKTFLMPPLGDKEPAPYFTLFDEERNAFMVSARDVVAGGNSRGVYVLNKGGFKNLKTQQDYYTALKKSFPTPFSEEHYQEMSRQLVGAILCHGNQNTHCSQIWAPDAVLVGDAAHSMWPTLGQGVNSALEDAAVLSNILKDCRGDLSAVPLAFHEARHKDVVAVVDLTWRSYGEGKHAISAVSIIKSMLLFWGAKLLPDLVPRPALSLMNETNMPYAEIMHRQEEEERTLSMAAAALGMTALAAPTVLLAPLATTAAAAAASVLGN